jgi:hypothetical protein
VQRWIGKIFWVAVGKLGMTDGAHGLDIVVLVQADFLCVHTLDVLDTAIRKRVPIQLHLAKHFLNALEHLRNQFLCTGGFQVIHVL